MINVKKTVYLTAVLISLLILCFPDVAKAESSPRFKAVAFDYFVIFNPNSIISKVEEVFPGKSETFVKTWRSKQFEYGYLRSITNHHEDFFKVTEDALVYTAHAMQLELTPRTSRSF